MILLYIVNITQYFLIMDFTLTMQDSQISNSGFARYGNTKRSWRDFKCCFLSIINGGGTIKQFGIPWENTEESSLVIVVEVLLLCGGKDASPQLEHYSTYIISRSKYSHVTALQNLFCLMFLCNSISFILSYFSARPCPACLRPNSNNSLTIWTRQPCNTTNTFLSYQYYCSSFN